MTNANADRKPNFLCLISAMISGTFAALLLVGLLFATTASATVEQVATFGDKSGDRHLLSSTGLAVNATGAGGVVAGSLYRVGRGFSEGGVTRYGPKGELLGHFDSFVGMGIAVHQTTGNVYALEELTSGNQVQVYSADGSELITSFGEKAAPGETIKQAPEKLHFNYASSIAVDDSGIVYIADSASDTSRVMVFEPQNPGDFSHYVYAGQGRDIVFSSSHVVTGLAVDGAGNVYVTADNQVSIEEYDPSNPNTPICRYDTPGRQGGILGMTVDPIRGEVFYFSGKDKKIHQLSACNEGKFKESAKIDLAPKASQIDDLAFNPLLAWDAFRPAGILYGAESETSPTLTGQGYIFAAPQVLAPEVEEESVGAVTSSTATLKAQINPKGSPTGYVFQYLTETAYQENEASDRFAGAIEAPLDGATLGSGNEALSAAAAVSGLEPDTKYRYRVIATSNCDPADEEKVCKDTGDDQAFRTFPVEPPDLPDNRAYELVSPAQKFGGEVIPAHPNVGSCRECKPGAGGEIGGFPMQSAPDGEAVAYEGQPFSFSEGAAIFNEYLSKRTPSGWQTATLSPLLMEAGDRQGPKAFDASLTQGLLYHVSPTLSPEAPGEYANLYIQPTADPSVLSPLLLAEPPNRPAGGAGRFEASYAGASANFSQIFFSANDALTGETTFAPEAEDGGPKKSNLYEWRGGQLRLVNVLPGNAEAPVGASFGSASAHAISEDGSRAFWSSESGQLYVRIDGESTRAIPDPGKFLVASADGSKVLLSNGHIYDLEAEAIVDLADGKGGFDGILGQGEDLSQIYFLDTAVLDEAPNDQGAVAQVGKENLYAWNEGAVTFVATLASQSGGASPNGRWLAFLSTARLSGYDNVGCGVEGLNRCDEAFLYDSATESLVCASCNPSGARPLGPTLLSGGEVPEPRYLTNSGRLYFDSRDSLSPSDTNSGVEDVYQYEPEGIGTCKRQGGCISLISAGHEAVDSNFMTMDPTGKNVFFTSRDQLVLKDRDELVDLYVAREDGGIPAESEVARTECLGEACQGTIVAPNDPTPGSSSFEGAGNVDEKKATKKHKKKHKHAKKAPHKKRAHKRAANHNRGGAK